MENLSRISTSLPPVSSPRPSKALAAASVPPRRGDTAQAMGEPIRDTGDFCAGSPSLLRAAGRAKGLPAGALALPATGVDGSRQGRAPLPPAAPRAAPLAAETIAPERCRQIRECLEQIEREKGVRIVYACESGSRAWGFSSADSDYDVRFVYVHDVDWYLQVTPQRDVIEVPIDDDLDISGWELRKALALIKGGNATFGEWLGSPIVYRFDPLFCDAVRDTLGAVYAPNRGHYHYINMAKRNFRMPAAGEQAHVKKLLYALRPLLAALWIEAYNTAPPTLFGDLVEALVTDPPLRQEIEALVRIKRTLRESDGIPPPPHIHQFINEQLPRLLQCQPPKLTNLPFDRLDVVLRHTVKRLDRPAVAAEVE